MLTEESTGRELKVVVLSDLQVDHGYQRDLNQNLVEKILQDYDPVAADALTVSLREDESMWIVNGQHRAAAQSLFGESETLAWVHTGLTREQEADLRLKSNNRRSDSPLERFRAQVEAGYPESVQISQILEEFGTQINRVFNSSTGVNCVACVEAVYRLDDGLLLRNTLKLLNDSWGRIGGEAAQEPVIRGVAWFIRMHSTEMSRPELRDRMKRVGIDDIMRKMRSHKSAMGGSLWINFYRALVETYNHRRNRDNRLEWRTSHAVQLDRNQLGLK